MRVQVKIVHPKKLYFDWSRNLTFKASLFKSNICSCWNINVVDNLFKLKQTKYFSMCLFPLVIRDLCLDPHDSDHDRDFLFHVFTYDTNNRGGGINESCFYLLNQLGLPF